MNRQDANRAILGRLILEVEQYPELRFGQILVNLGVLVVEDPGRSCRDPFSEESTTTLARMRRTP